MCLMIWRTYPIGWEVVVAHAADLNRFLADEIKRPKAVGWPQDSIEFILGRMAQILMSANFDHDKGDFDSAYREIMQKPWE